MTVFFKKRNRNGGNGRKDPDVIPLGSVLTGERSFSIGNIQEPGPTHTPQTPSDIEANLRKKIEVHVKDYAWKYDYKIERINSEIKRTFGKPRAQMTLNELKNVLSFIKDAYPLYGQGLIPFVTYRPRGRGRRLSARPEIIEAPRQMGFWG